MSSSTSVEDCVSGRKKGVYVREEGSVRGKERRKKRKRGCVGGGSEGAEISQPVGLTKRSSLLP